jgi:hypothetical protein
MYLELGTEFDRNKSTKHLTFGAKLVIYTERDLISLVGRTYHTRYTVHIMMYNTGRTT